MARGQLSSLPEEIVVEILSRLPAKSIGQFRSVSKPWCVLLSDPQFINTHLNNRRTEQNLILIFDNRSIHTITDVGVDNASRTIRFDQPELPETWTEVVGSCNGLVLLLHKKKGLFLVNPTTLNQVKIPDTPGLNRGIRFVYGLGHDAASDDYKIVAISDRDVVNGFELDYVGEFVLMYSFVYMYSMKRGVWKRLERLPYHHAISVPFASDGFWPGVFVNGSIHWLAYTRDTKGSSLIAAFDLVDEKFKEIPTPGCLNVKTLVHNELLVLKGSLCMVDEQNTIDQVDIWIMKEYGVKESWVKLRVTLEYNWVMVKPLCFIGDGKIVLEINGCRFIVYEFKTGTLRDFMVDGVPATFKDRGTFMDSLVWPSYCDLM